MRSTRPYVFEDTAAGEICRPYGLTSISVGHRVRLRGRRHGTLTALCYSARLRCYHGDSVMTTSYFTHVSLSILFFDKSVLSIVPRLST